MNNLFIPRFKNCTLDEIASLLKANSVLEFETITSTKQLSKLLSEIDSANFIAIHYDLNADKLLAFNENIEEDLEAKLLHQDFVFGFICHGEHYLKSFNHLVYFSYNDFIPTFSASSGVEKPLVKFFESIFTICAINESIENEVAYKEFINIHKTLIDHFKQRNEIWEAVLFTKWLKRFIKNKE